MKFVRWVLSLVSSPRLQENTGEGKMALLIVEVVPVGMRPPTVDDSMRSSTAGYCDFGASAPLLTRASPMHFSEANKRGSAIMLKLTKLVGPSLTLAEELSPRLAHSTAAPSVRLRVFISDLTSTSGGVVAELDAAGLPNDALSLSSSQYACLAACPIYRIFLLLVDINPPSWVCQTQIHHDGEMGH